MIMRKSVSRVKDMLEGQGYSPETAKEILELFDPPKGAKAKGSSKDRQ
jgi:hypothetical protein